jgi:hypothetical protein
VREKREGGGEECVCCVCCVYVRERSAREEESVQDTGEYTLYFPS